MDLSLFCHFACQEISGGSSHIPVLVLMMHRQHSQDHSPYKHAARQTTRHSLIMQAACLCASGLVQPFLKRASGFSLFDISFLQAFLCWSEAERLCLICTHDGNKWVFRERRATFALQQLGRNAAEPFSYFSRVWRRLGRWMRFRTSSGSAFFKEKVLVTKLGNMMTLSICWQHPTDRLITCCFFFFFFFLLIPQTSTQ